MISLFPFFANINISSNYYKLYVPRIHTDELFINASVFNQQNKINKDHHDEFKCIEQLSIYKILLDGFLLIKNGNILKRTKLFQYVDIIDKNVVIHLSPYIKYLMSHERNDKITQTFMRLIDHNLINFVKNDNFVRSGNIIFDKEYQLEKIILTIAINIIQLHINLYNKEHTNITNLFQYCQYDKCKFISSHENMCIMHKNFNQQMTILNNIYEDYPIDTKIICTSCMIQQEDIIFTPRDYIPICSCCLKKNAIDINNSESDSDNIVNGIKQL